MTYAQFIELMTGEIVEENRDAREFIDTTKKKLTCELIRLPDGEDVLVERSNGYVISGYKAGYGKWAIDLRNDSATIVTPDNFNPVEWINSTYA